MKYYYLNILHKPIEEQDVIYLNNLLYKKEFINQKKFQFLVMRFQTNIDKYIYNFKAPQLSSFVSKFDQTEDCRFY